MDHCEKAPQRLLQPSAVVLGLAIRQRYQKLHVADQMGQTELNGH